MENAQEKALQRYDATELSKKEQERILKEIGETDESKKECLKDLTKKLQEQKEFSPCLEEDFLLKFLRHSKYDCTKAFSRLKKFYRIQQKFPDYFELCSESALRNSRHTSMDASPYRMNDNSVLCINKFFIADPSVVSAKEKFYLDVLVHNELLENPLNQMCGVSAVVDMSDFSLSKLLDYNPYFLKVYIETMQGAFPMRIKALHVVKTTKIFRVLHNIIYPLMSKKMQNRFHVHYDNETWKDLHSFIPPEILPEEYGGHLKQSNLINLLENLHENEKNFRKHSPFLLAKEQKS